MKPRFITFEGGEGTGKSTQVQLLAETLRQSGIPCLTTREPGGSAGAEAIRALVVSGDGDRWHPTTEALLFMAARHDHLTHTIHPALARGEWVICDRFYDSTFVYQGIAKQVGTDWLDGLYHQLFSTFIPDITLWLTLSPEEGLTRATARESGGETRFERMGTPYHQQVHAGFAALAARDPARIRPIDASGDAAMVHGRIWQEITRRFDLQ